MTQAELIRTAVETVIDRLQPDIDREWGESPSPAFLLAEEVLAALANGGAGVLRDSAPEPHQYSWCGRELVMNDGSLLRAEASGLRAWVPPALKPLSWTIDQSSPFEHLNYFNEDVSMSLAAAIDAAREIEASELDTVAKIATAIDGGVLELHAANGRGIHFRVHGLDQHHWAVQYISNKGIEKFTPPPPKPEGVVFFSDSQLASAGEQIEVVADWCGHSIVGQTIYQNGQIETWNASGDGPQDVPAAVEDERRSAAAMWLAKQAGHEVISVAEAAGGLLVEVA